MYMTLGAIQEHGMLVYWRILDVFFGSSVDLNEIRHNAAFTKICTVCLDESKSIGNEVHFSSEIPTYGTLILIMDQHIYIPA